MRLLVWLFRAAIFFTLFSFALNNQQDAGINWFFGHEWRAPMVFIVLGAFATGCACGVFAMVPSWWQQRRVARKRATHPVMADGSAADAALLHPSRDGL